MIHGHGLAVSYNAKAGRNQIIAFISVFITALTVFEKDFRVGDEIESIVVTPFKPGDSDAAI